jgi:hypothetical protein
MIPNSIYSSLEDDIRSNGEAEEVPAKDMKTAPQ